MRCSGGVLSALWLEIVEEVLLGYLEVFLMREC